MDFCLASLEDCCDKDLSRECITPSGLDSEYTGQQMSCAKSARKKNAETPSELEYREQS